MKRIIKLTVVALLLTVILQAQDRNSKPLILEKTAIVKQSSSKPLTSIATLTVTCLTNRTQPLGGSFQHKVTLMNGTNPIPKADVKINDPIGRVCTSVTTDSKGEATWTQLIPSDAKQQIYAIEFFYETVKQYSTVAVTHPPNVINLPSYSTTLN